MSDVATAGKADDKGKLAATPAEKGKMPGASGFDVGKASSKTGDVAGEPANEKASADMTSDERERNVVFGSLVKGDDDIVGLVAYSIYKQNKHDWLVGFNKSKDREPDEAESYSYIVGESTARRLAIYRHLAQATLEGNGPQVSGGTAKDKFVQHSLANANTAAGRGRGSSGLRTVGWVVALVAIVAAMYIGAKYGMPGVTR